MPPVIEYCRKWILLLRVNEFIWKRLKYFLFLVANSCSAHISFVVYYSSLHNSELFTARTCWKI